MSRLRVVTALVTLMSGPGCVSFVQTRYSVFGLDAWQTETPEQARAVSLGLIAAVAVVSAALGATAPALVRRWRGRRANREAQMSPPTAAASTRGREVSVT